MVCRLLRKTNTNKTEVDTIYANKIKQAYWSIYFPNTFENFFINVSIKSINSRFNVFLAVKEIYESHYTTPNDVIKMHIFTYKITTGTYHLSINSKNNLTNEFTKSSRWRKLIITRRDGIKHTKCNCFGLPMGRNRNQTCQI